MIEVDTEAGFDLGYHGDRELAPGLVDLAVNVRAGMPPQWLLERLQAVDLARYPDQNAARTAVARRHGRSTAEVLLTAGAAEAFVLVARAFRFQQALVVHPQFTEPEAALRNAGHRVDRFILPPPFGLSTKVIDHLAEHPADLLVLGNPTNPTSIAHSAAAISRLARPGRILLVDEAFADCLPDEYESLADRDDLPGLVVVRSLTKTWGLAGLRAGYLLAADDLIAQLLAAQPLWAVSAPALAACVACSEPAALAEATAWAHHLTRQRESLCRHLSTLPGVKVHGQPAASFVLIEVPDHFNLQERLAADGFAVRRGETFPGLDKTWLRIAVRDEETTQRFIEIFRKALS